MIEDGRWTMDDIVRRPSSVTLRTSGRETATVSLPCKLAIISCPSAAGGVHRHLSRPLRPLKDYSSGGKAAFMVTLLTCPRLASSPALNVPSGYPLSSPWLCAV